MIVEDKGVEYDQDFWLIKIFVTLVDKSSNQGKVVLVNWVMWS